ALISLRIRASALGVDSVVERDREIVVRPIQTSLVDRSRLERSFGHAIRITPNSLRLRVTELTMPWQDALDIVISEAERTMDTVSLVAD
ncbi:MAG: hypothetical protein H0T93_12085, partial [Chloroflexia bacterium]|nr:hypothetical protein [Chloroflexia bacterium]